MTGVYSKEGTHFNSLHRIGKLLFLITQKVSRDYGSSGRAQAASSNPSTTKKTKNQNYSEF
jgi:hypothetical protein